MICTNKNVGRTLHFNAIKLRDIVGWATCFLLPGAGLKPAPGPDTVGNKNTLPTLQKNVFGLNLMALTLHLLPQSVSSPNPLY
ncbi:MAG: hypothetical protein ABFS56_30715 [Pseudomonadota bacterium]